MGKGWTRNFNWTWFFVTQHSGGRGRILFLGQFSYTTRSCQNKTKHSVQIEKTKHSSPFWKGLSFCFGNWRFMHGWMLVRVLLMATILLSLCIHGLSLANVWGGVDGRRLTLLWFHRQVPSASYGPYHLSLYLNLMPPKGLISLCHSIGIILKGHNSVHSTQKGLLCSLLISTPSEPLGNQYSGF